MHREPNWNEVYGVRKKIEDITSVRTSILSRNTTHRTVLHINH